MRMKSEIGTNERRQPLRRSDTAFPNVQHSPLSKDIRPVVGVCETPGRELDVLVLPSGLLQAAHAPRGGLS